MTRLFLTIACFTLFILGIVIADKEYAEHGHDHHHHHHHHHDHDGRKFIRIIFVYLLKVFFQMIIMIMNHTRNYLLVFKQVFFVLS